MSEEKKMQRLRDYQDLFKSHDKENVFNDNYLDILDRLHPDLPMRYKVDFVMKAALTGADPRKGQIHLTSYFSKKLGHKVGVCVHSYHFFINQANQTGELGGFSVETALEDIYNPLTQETAKELVATAVIERKGRKAVTFKARWSECFNKMSDNWKNRPYQMLEKTAIAGGMRWQFPEVLSNMYIEEEIRDEHIVEAERVTESFEKEKKAKQKIVEIEDAKKEAVLGNKSDIIKVLIDKCNSSTGGMTVDDKVCWLKENYGVASPDDLKRLPVDKLKGLMN